MNKFEKFGNVIWMDGAFLEPKDAQISVMSHAIHYGAGFFEGIRAYQLANGQAAIFRLDEHLERLFLSIQAYYLTIPYDLATLRQAVMDVVAKNEIPECYIRPSVFAGMNWSTITVDEQTDIHTTISTWAMPGNLNPQTKEIAAKISPYRRLSGTMMPISAKASANYMNSQLMKYEAVQSGVQDAIALDMNGYISEASTANVFLVFGNEIHTPSLDCSVLNGITRKSILTLATDLGYQVIEGHIGRDELIRADEIFTAGTAAEITSIVEMDYRRVGVGNTTVASELLRAYQAVTRGENEQYHDWLTLV